MGHSESKGGSAAASSDAVAGASSRRRADVCSFLAGPSAAKWAPRDGEGSSRWEDGRAPRQDHMSVGDVVVIAGVCPPVDRDSPVGRCFTVNLKDGHGRFVLHADVRQEPTGAGGNPVVVRNSKGDGPWDKEERFAASPFKAGRPFTMAIVAKEDQFLLLAWTGSSRMWSAGFWYRHQRVEDVRELQVTGTSGHVSSLRCSVIVERTNAVVGRRLVPLSRVTPGDFELSGDVRWRVDGSDDASGVAVGSLRNGDCIHLRGITPKAHSREGKLFTLNLIARSAGTADTILLHVDVREAHVVRNAKFGSHWGFEEVGDVATMFRPGDPFVLFVEVHRAGFRVVCVEKPERGVEPACASTFFPHRGHQEVNVLHVGSAPGEDVWISSVAIVRPLENIDSAEASAAAARDDQTKAADRSRVLVARDEAGDGGAGESEDADTKVSASSDEVPPPASEPAVSECTLCLDAACEAVVVPCGHCSMCMPCAEGVQAAGQPCPMCRGPIASIVKLYMA